MNALLHLHINSNTSFAKCILHFPLKLFLYAVATLLIPNSIDFYHNTH